jgi:hypothetical protein
MTSATKTDTSPINHITINAKKYAQDYGMLFSELPFIANLLSD